MSNGFDSAINGIQNGFSALTDGFSTVFNFITGIPTLFHNLYNCIPSPINTIILSFIPLIIACIFYKVARGY